MSTIGERIRELRKERGMDQRELAEQTGLERDQIAKIETGRRNVSATELPYLADALNVAPSALLRQVERGVMFRLGRLEADDAKAAVEWFENYAESSATLRALERDRDDDALAVR